jgi:hypothetical protein
MILAGLAATGATLSFIIAPVREGMRVRLSLIHI